MTYLLLSNTALLLLLALVWTRRTWANFILKGTLLVLGLANLVALVAAV